MSKNILTLFSYFIDHIGLDMASCFNGVRIILEKRACEFFFLGEDPYTDLAVFSDSVAKCYAGLLASKPIGKLIFVAYPKREAVIACNGFDRIERLF